MSELERILGASPKPSLGGYTVNLPLIGKIIAANATVLQMPEVIKWDGSVVCSLDLSSFIGNYVQKGIASSLGNGFHYADEIEIPSDEFWRVYAWSVQCDNCDIRYFGYKVPGATAVMRICGSVVGAAGSANDWGVFDGLPLPASTQFCYYEENDAGLDTVTMLLYIQRFAL